MFVIGKLGYAMGSHMHPSQPHPDLYRTFDDIRTATETLCVSLSPEDQCMQGMPSASPVKWHRAHTSWFFERFVLAPLGRSDVNPLYDKLFNSYYEAVGPRIARDKRHLISRPTTVEVSSYRETIDSKMREILTGAPLPADVCHAVKLGLAHEQQHQELILTDILSAFYENPAWPVYREKPPSAPRRLSQSPEALSWKAFSGGLVEIGCHSNHFSFDNERPRHRVYLEPFQLASRPITVGDVKEFIRAGGYRQPLLWLSAGYECAQQSGWRAPLYAEYHDGSYRCFSLRGWRTPSDAEPASHLSFWEADAIARFFQARLPTEAEWEVVAADGDSKLGNFADGELTPDDQNAGAMFGNVWEWTRSSYEPYPGFQPDSREFGEYNGKFMAQQFVLRGGSCFTPRRHVTATYRNYWHPETRFQMTGARLARNA